eukprot:TRINITY_DN24623_c0_g1_i1.p1 TRINITY_DN24623_c0_g1~~TRINITY_DN24623_c0_g1_i1.p1  ORF type:complete len:107 (-),score=9.81 TRINITY_DN24623_c0_g1_i1:81-380(-)
MAEYNIVVVGEAGVGKTSLAVTLIGSSLVDYDPTIADSFRKQLIIDADACILEIFDTSGPEEYLSLREPLYRNGEGFLFVYSITCRSSFEELSRYRKQS